MNPKQGLERAKREIRDRLDLVTVVSEHVRLKRSGKRWLGLCPFHSEKTPSFSVVPEMGIFKCFGCGKAGDVFTFVQFRENVSFIEALRLLADRAGVDLPSRRSPEDGGIEASRVDFGRVNAWAAEFFRSRLEGQAGQAAREYLRSRGLKDATVAAFGLGLAVDGAPSLAQAAAKAGFAPSLLVSADLLRVSEDGRTYETFRDRIMFPIRDATRRVIAFGGRTLVDDRAKYLNTRQTPVFEKGRGLFGVDLARESIASRGRAIVVEGYTDCMACHQAGFTETIATLGTALTESQVDLVRRYADELVLLFDSDAAGEEAANRAVGVALPRSVRIRLARIPSGKDPAEFLGAGHTAAFADVLNRSVDALEFLWRRTAERFEATTSNAARREAVLSFIHAVGEAVSTTAIDAIQQGLLVNQVAHLLRLEHAEVHRLLRRASKPRGSGKASDGGGSRVAVERTLDAEQAAWSRLWAVLLNEPGLISRIDPFPDPARIADARVRRIASTALRLAETAGDFELSDVLSACEAEEDVALAVDLAQRGGDAARYRERLEGALDVIRRRENWERVERGRDQFREAERTNEDGRPALGLLAPERHQHFSPRRLIRAARGGSEGVSVPQTVDTALTPVQQSGSTPA